MVHSTFLDLLFCEAEETGSHTMLGVRKEDCCDISLFAHYAATLAAIDYGTFSL